MPKLPFMTIKDPKIRAQARKDAARIENLRKQIEAIDEIERLRKRIANLEKLIERLEPND